MDYFIFDDIDTRDYEGIYVFPSKVDDSPKRVYETKNIVGRNGAMYVDQGRYEDAVQTYSIAALTKDVASDLINALESKVGHFRLEDSFNPTEFYSAVFTSGVEVKTESERNKCVFSLTFTRKPQRWLKSGESAVTVADGGTLDNPTPFESKPLLAVKGYGDIEFNGFTISLENGELGDVTIVDRDTFVGKLETKSASKTYTIPEYIYENGDAIDVNIGEIKHENLGIQAASGSVRMTSAAITITDSNANFTSRYNSTYTSPRAYNVSVFTNVSTITLTAGTDSTITNTVTLNAVVSTLHDGDATITWTITQTIVYDATNRTITVSVSHTSSSSDATKVKPVMRIGDGWTVSNVGIILHSTASMLGNPTYIDCDIGECYMFKGDNIVSLNDRIMLGYKLPTLATGTNTFDYSNTVTELKVTARWWKV